MSAEESFCAACFAEPGEPCAWDCVGLASQLDALEALATDAAAKLPAERSDDADHARRGFCPLCDAAPLDHCGCTRRDAPGSAIDAHCLVCHAARLSDGRHAEGLIARWMTVQASKDYARVYFRHELDASEVE